MIKEAAIYQTGNAWEKKVYRHMAAYLESKGVKRFGETTAGNQYRHWLCDEDAELNFVNPSIYKTTLERFEKHKAGDLKRILTNTAASQPYCFNLFVHLSQNPGLADALFSELLSTKVEIAHIEPEFTPNKLKELSGFEQVLEDESIGDQSEFAGTDADVAIFYKYGNSQKGVLLIEFKFIEPEFSVCSSYKKKIEAKPICDNPEFFDTLIAKVKTDSKGNPLCGYTKYQNWNLTSTSTVIDGEKVRQSAQCPFRFGLNQLWRNMLLAERVATARGLDRFGFWVFSPKPNDEFLWKERGHDVEQLFRHILTEKGNECFKKIHLEDIITNLETLIKYETDITWLTMLKEKYWLV